MLADELIQISPSTSESSQHHEAPSEPPNAKKQRQQLPQNALPSTTQPAELSPVDPVWQEIDPTPDVRALFAGFNRQFFGDKLSAVEVRWSPRMTLCAGMCVYEGNGGLCSVRLSEALLKFRSRSDLVETLLHEMIHAYLFVTQKNRDREGHGPNFKFHMNRINKAANTNITVYHSFHNEVDSYKVHWWHCNGPCAQRPPFFGLIRRAMNRAPGPNDLWWSEHQTTCNGKFIKIKEPNNYSRRNKKKISPDFLKPDEKPEIKKNYTKDLRSFFKKEDEQVKKTLPSQDPEALRVHQPSSVVVPFSGAGRVLGSGTNSNPNRLLAYSGPSKSASGGEVIRDINSVTCPVCNLKLSLALINIHLDTCISKEDTPVL